MTDVWASAGSPAGDPRADCLGKSTLALALVDRIRTAGGEAELISIDSMQVYRGMNVGTATPTAAEQAQVRHHLIDLVDPSTPSPSASSSRSPAARS